MIIKIPAKSLLFGEYGVLYGFTGIAFNSWTFYCEFDFQITSHSNFITIYSDYFGDSFLRINKEKIYKIFQIVKNQANRDYHSIVNELAINKDEFFFICALIPFTELLNKISFDLHITKYFSKNYGFGSSSAIISAIHLFFKTNFNLSDQTFWENAQLSIALSQTKGSGYDIAVQSKEAIINAKDTILNPKNKLWMFQKMEGIPLLEQMPASGHYGYIVKTDVYSDTAKMMSSFDIKSDVNIDYAKKHASIANDFINDTSLNNANILIKKALILQRQFKTTNPTIDQKFSCFNFKYLGAGTGDAIWVAPSKDIQIAKDCILEEIILD